MVDFVFHWEFKQMQANCFTSNLPENIREPTNKQISDVFSLTRKEFICLNSFKFQVNFLQ